jgi:hypothetical protein
MLSSVSSSFKPTIYCPARPLFGQMFIGEAGKVVVLEPKDIEGKEAILYQASPPNGSISKLGSSPTTKAWTEVIENYGPLFSKGSSGFYALTDFMRQSLLGPNSPIAMVPPADRQNAFFTLSKGKVEPFNGGVKFSYSA